jgi:hypothetical protein
MLVAWGLHFGVPEGPDNSKPQETAGDFSSMYKENKPYFVFSMGQVLEVKSKFYNPQTLHRIPVRASDLRREKV